jgi:hypothetical protein
MQKDGRRKCERKKERRKEKWEMAHGRRKRGVAEVEGGEGEKDIPTEDDHRKRNCAVLTSFISTALRTLESGRTQKGENAPGNISFIVKVTTSVVMSSLSAAGSRIEPSTVPRLKRRASQPSTCIWKRETERVGSEGWEKGRLARLQVTGRVGLASPSLLNWKE